MKKLTVLIAAAVLLPFALYGCGNTAAETASAGTTADETTAEETTNDEKTETEAAETEPWTETGPGTTAVEVIPDPSGVTLMIEDFNSVTDVKKSLSPLDLSVFGITLPEFSFDTELSQEGKAFVNTLTGSAWCQVFEISDNRLDVFREAKPEHYLRIFVAAPDGASVGLTFCLGTENGKNRSYIVTENATVTEITGKKTECPTGNDTDDAGALSSLRVPAGFCGYVALPLSELSPWRGMNGISSLDKVDYLKIDARPSVSSSGDRYALDALCISDSPTAELYPGRTTEEDRFATKNEELEYMFSALTDQKPVYEFCPEYDPKGYPGVKALWIDGVKYGGKDTKFFAYIGFPEGADASSPVPAVVLLHGGGYAYPGWVKLWCDRGYAAIAMCNTGYYPVSTDVTDFYGSASWTREIPSDVLEKDPRVMPPDNDGMYSSTAKVDRMWMYHAVSQTIISGNILRSDPRVDPDKIGITGISWGAVITSVAIGYDTRFAFAVPVYGSAYLDEAHSWMKDNFNSKGTKELWEPSLRLKNYKNPVLWLCWADDNCFSVNSNSKSYLNCENGTLSIIQNWSHGHIEGWSREEIYRFADSVVKGGGPLVKIKTLPEKGRAVSFEITVPGDARSVGARACYIDAPLSYSAGGRLHIPGQETIDQTWRFIKCTVKDGVVSAELPDNAVSYYVEITARCGKNSYVTCTPLADVE